MDLSLEAQQPHISLCDTQGQVCFLLDGHLSLKFHDRWQGISFFSEMILCLQNAVEQTRRYRSISRVIRIDGYVKLCTFTPISKFSSSKIIFWWSHNTPEQSPTLIKSSQHFVSVSLNKKPSCLI